MATLQRTVNEYTATIERNGNTFNVTFTRNSGEDGREVELQASATHIQWRHVGEVAWTNLIALSEITGPNQVSTSTDTNITGLLKGNGTKVAQAVAGTDYVPIETAATFAAISASNTKRLVQVTADETNSGETTLYYHNGTILNWVVTQNA